MNSLTKSAVFALACGVLVGGALAKNDAPNLIIVLTDDQGYADVGFNGCEDIPTPNIDRIAHEGVKFTDGYVSFPVCGPSRAGLLTGRYQDRFGFTTNPTINPEVEIAGLPFDEENVAEVLRKADYSSAIVGKWHMGSHPSQHPLSRGFDYFFGFLSGGHNYFPSEYVYDDLSEVTTKWGWYRTRLMENRERVDVEGDYLTDILTAAAVDFIDDQAKGDAPFMLYLAYNAPHTPMQATEKYLSRFPNLKGKRKVYAAMVSSVDDGVGRVFEALERNDMDENTIVVFLSDNGGAHNNASINAPLSKGKGSLFEGGVRVPFAMRWPGGLPAGKVYSEPVISLDVMATITELAGVKISPERPLDGVNLVPYLTGAKSGAPHERLFWRKFDRDAVAVRAGSMKLVADGRRETEGYKLFDLSNDVGEKNNLGPRRPETEERLVSESEAWLKELRPLAFPTLMGDEWWTR